MENDTLRNKAANILEVENMNTYYNETHILRNVSIKLTEKNLVLLLGRNGMGKTTTIYSIIGFCHLRSGRILFRDIEIETFPCYKRVRLGISLIPQGRRIFPSLSCEENLTFAYRKVDLESSGTVLKRYSVEEIYRMFPVLEKRSKVKAKFLSGGEQQMLSIARVLLGNPDLCLMDEPFEGLAPLIINEIVSVISELKNNGLSILLVLPNVNLLWSLKIDHVYLMHKGEISYDSLPSELLNNKEVMDRYLGIGGGII